MSQILAKNADMASKFKDIIGLRYEPVAIKLVKKGEEFPGNFPLPEKQQSHCQAICSAKDGKGLKMPFESEGCMVGACSLGMTERSEKIATGNFHAGIGIHSSAEAAKEMFDTIVDVPYETAGEVICPLKEADFEPDVVVFVDIPERLYWFECLHVRNGGGRVKYLTAPFQCTCADCTSYPLVNKTINASLGCYGCRRKTNLKPEEMVMGVYYPLLDQMAKDLDVYKDGVLTKAKRD